MQHLKAPIDTRILNYLLIVVFAVCSTGVIVTNSTIVNPYTLGEWLINYAGGFVRRGLSGSLVLLVAEWTGLAPKLLLNAALAFLFALNLLLVGMLFRHIGFLRAYWFLFAPALFLMVPTDVVNRKENIFYLLLLIHALLFLRGGLLLNTFEKYFLPILGLIATLIHELYVFILPFHFLIILQRADRPNTLYVLLLNSLPVAGFMLALLFPGTIVQRAAMCSELAKSWISCEGGLQAIGLSAHHSIATSVSVLNDTYSLQSYWLVYGLTNLVTFILFRSSLLHLAKQGGMKLFIFANIMFPIVFITGWDIGRWTALFSIHNFVVLAILSLPSRQHQKLTELTLIGRLFFGFSIVSLSLFLDNRGCCGYHKTEAPMTSSRISWFLASGVDLLIGNKSFDQTRFGVGRDQSSHLTELGETLSFNDARLRFTGWHDAETGHRWSAGTNSEIALLLRLSSTDQVAGRMTVLLRSLNMQNARISLNDSIVYDGHLTGSEQKLTLPFPTELVHNGLNTIRFDLQDARSPGNDDLRILGVALKSITIE